MALIVGTQLGSHEIIAPVGKGGMGEVYRARDLKLKREVAINARFANQAPLLQLRCAFRFSRRRKQLFFTAGDGKMTAVEVRRRIRRTLNSKPVRLCLSSTQVWESFLLRGSMSLRTDDSSFRDRGHRPHLPQSTSS